jgi:Uma2 family endonuclease
MPMILETPPTVRSETLADLVERLGGIPLDRIRMNPPPGTATEEDVLALEARADKRLCELIDGVLVEKAMGFRESFLASYLIRVLGNFIAISNPGIVTAPDGFVRLFVGRVRIPDVSFISWDRLPDRRVPDEPMPMVAPDLVVEVLSKGNTKGEMELKRQDYFAAGTRLMWIAQPKNRTVRVYTSPDSFHELDENGILDGGDVLPGFTLPLREWFGELDRHG